ncbi:MAG: hypothetical protein KJ630_08930 [Proteobacteria bacterium]|nr:hypothetical protein [Pseudomonadota bacterium]
MARIRWGGWQLRRKVVGGILVLAMSHGLALSANAGEEVLDRFFYTPEERTVLEILREASVRQTPFDVAPTDKVDDTKNRPRLITLGGTVTRKDKVQALWLNGQRYPATGLQVNVEVEKPYTAGQVLLQVPENGMRYPLRPGQTLDLNNGRIREAYEPAPVDASAGTKAAGVAEPASSAGPAEEGSIKP